MTHTLSVSTFILAVAVTDDRPRGQILARGTQANFIHLARFHRLCAKYAFCPTYLLSYSAMRSSNLQWLQQAFERDECEIGTYFESWSTPPFAASENRLATTPTHRLNRSMVRRKLETLCETFEKNFGVPPRVNMSEGFDFSSNAVQALNNCKFKVDLSFAPGYSYTGHPRDNIDHTPYFPQLQDVLARGSSGVLEIPILTSAVHPIPNWVQSAVPEGVVSTVGKLARAIKTRRHPVNLARLTINQFRQALIEQTIHNREIFTLATNSYELGVGTADLAQSESELSDLLFEIDQSLRTLADDYKIRCIGALAAHREHVRQALPDN